MHSVTLNTSRRRFKNRLTLFVWQHERVTVSYAAAKGLRVSSDLGQHIAWLQGDLTLGFECVYLHAVTRNPEGFLETFADKVLPACPA